MCLAGERKETARAPPEKCPATEFEGNKRRRGGRREAERGGGWGLLLQWGRPRGSSLVGLEASGEIRSADQTALAFIAKQSSLET